MRGKTAEEGATYVSDNGYHYTKKGGKFRLTHHLVAEQRLGRALADGERVTFHDKDKTNLDPSNIVVSAKGKMSIARRVAQIEARIAELEAQRDDLLDEQP